MTIEDEPGHAAYIAALARDLSPTVPPLNEPSTEVPVDAGVKVDGSPSAVASAESALILRFTALQKALPSLQEDAVIMAEKVSATKREMVEIERLLRAHKRLREPIRRKR